MSIDPVDWTTFVDEAPDLADAVTPLLRRTAHHVLATLRRDGSPRVSGTEVQFVGREHSAGALVDALVSKLRDAADHPDPPDGVALLRLGLTQVTHTAIHPDRDRLVIRTWHPGRTVESVERA